jgi:hypothetical protein
MLVDDDGGVVCLPAQEFAERDGLGRDGLAADVGDLVIGVRHPPLVRFQRRISSRSAPEIDDFAAHQRGTVGVEGESLPSPHDVERQLTDDGGSCLSHSGESLLRKEGE